MNYENSFFEIISSNKNIYKEKSFLFSLAIFWFMTSFSLLTIAETTKHCKSSSTFLDIETKISKIMSFDKKKKIKNLSLQQKITNDWIFPFYSLLYIYVFYFFYFFFELWNPLFFLKASIFIIFFIYFFFIIVLYCIVQQKHLCFFIFFSYEVLLQWLFCWKKNIFHLINFMWMVLEVKQYSLCLHS